MSNHAGSVNFPGAVNSKFTNKLEFHNPTSQTAMPTFRVMDSDGLIVDSSRPEPDLSNDELVKLYMDMLTGRQQPRLQTDTLTDTPHS